MGAARENCVGSFEKTTFGVARENFVGSSQGNYACSSKKLRSKLNKENHALGYESKLHLELQEKTTLGVPKENCACSLDKI